MLGRRVEVLKEKLQELEKEHNERLTAGEKTGKEADIVHVCCDHSHSALERQRANLEEVAERRLTWSLRDKETEMQQELSYQVSGCAYYVHALQYLLVIYWLACWFMCRWIESIVNMRVS